MHTPNALYPEVGGALLSGGKHTTFCTFLVHSLSLQICFKLDAGQRLRNKLTGTDQINWSFSEGKGRAGTKKPDERKPCPKAASNWEVCLSSPLITATVDFEQDQATRCTRPPSPLPAAPAEPIGRAVKLTDSWDWRAAVPGHLSQSGAQTLTFTLEGK